MNDQIKCELQEVMGSDIQIANSAWTSSTEYQTKKLKSEEDIKRIINMLADLKHSVPFESVILRFWMRIPISIDRQIMTHRIASHSGMSGRYRTMPEEFLNVPDDITQILKRVQISENWHTYINRYNELCKESNFVYRQMLGDFKKDENNGVLSNKEYKRLREFFRGMLPQHNMTERVSIFNLRSFANFVKLRNKEEAQPEIRHLAQKMLDEVKNKNVCPIALESLERNNWII